jgi:hypothetical protein
MSTGTWIDLSVLNQADALDRDAALAAEPQNMNAGAGAQRSKKVSKGVCADPSPPALGGKSVSMVNPPNRAATRVPPGKPILIFMLQFLQCELIVTLLGWILNIFDWL